MKTKVKHRWLVTFLLFLFGFSFSLVSYASSVLTGTSNGMTYQVNLIARNLSIPWGMTFITQKQLLITQRQGTALLLNLENNTRTPIKGLPKVAARGQGGLLDVITEPSYQYPNNWIYFTYSQHTNRGAVTVLARAKLSFDTLTSWEKLLITDSATLTSRHFGSRIVFDKQGHLFFSVGDRGARPNGQDLTNHAGSILRLNLDGSVPNDNPFTNQSIVRPEIWSYGHRNPQGLAYDKQANRLWAIEHGPRGGDEVNLIRKGKNYGWPITSHGKEYWGPLAVGEATEKEGIESPKKIYIPSIAPGSLLLYTGEAFPAWQGDLFAGALKLEHINHLSLDDAGSIIAEERLITELGERVRALIQSTEGLIYFSTDNGNLYQISPLQP
ncbi:PQQ-dependent sugar dehydrogenase [uncultured Photobacterium sp.]|uniref:PQQ-dependent sugar dehydrogenase n=1 Tax=uncultured Photobacterium sp. TaxID=173973 RepID=UPI00260189B0|nr:PQQ-dependent sugar dehydrogenase [uncultured Photobacterium sp.]